MAWGNVAGMGLQAGCLAAGNPSTTIIIDKSEFAFNGSDGGMTYNIYIDDIGKVVLSNSYIHDVLGGGSEFRSRGPDTTIINNRIYDNSQSANYVLDLPSGGNVLIKDNVIQKSATPTNPALIHWGGSVLVPFHDGSNLTVSNNVIINNNPSRIGIGILNQSNTLNPSGVVTVPALTGNQFYGLPSSASRICRRRTRATPCSA